LSQPYGRPGNGRWAGVARKVYRNQSGERAFCFRRHSQAPSGNKAHRHRVDEGPEWFDKIVRKREGVAAIAMMNTDLGMQARRDDGTGEQRTQDGIAVIEKLVEAICRAVATKIFAHKQRPVTARRLRLHIVGIA
jgi:hypothetical protein